MIHDGTGRLRVLILEPYHGGSHSSFIDAILGGLDLEADVLTLPARKWKWRMRGAAMTMADETRAMAAARTSRCEERCWDLVFASTFVNLAEFKGLAGRAVEGVPAIVYFHENQLAYPVRHEEEWDFQFPLTNITSALAADVCLFNTHYNLESFLSEIPGFLRRFPDHRPTNVVERILAKSRVLHPPFDPAPFDTVRVRRGTLPRVVWPHRWEHDKAPEVFFAAVADLAAEGLPFEVAVAGQVFEDRPSIFGRAGALLGARLVHFGEPASREEYAALIAACDVAVSTARNEFFGLAMMEASYAGCYPLVPDRLAYRELYPAEMRYRDEDELVARLRSLLTERPEPGAAHQIAAAYTLGRLSMEYQAVFEETVGRTQDAPTHG